ncbi:MAG: hypothetical protein ABR529_09120 [Actinomycetota bacterium]
MSIQISEQNEIRIEYGSRFYSLSYDMGRWTLFRGDEWTSESSMMDAQDLNQVIKVPLSIREGIVNAMNIVRERKEPWVRKENGHGNDQ